MTWEDIDLKIIDDRPSILKRICHGKPERCLWFGGHPFPLCSRCGSFYPSILIGILAGILIELLFRPSSLFMLILVSTLFLPLILDGSTQYQGLRNSNNYIRIATGILAGAGAGIALIYIISSLADLV